MSWSHLALNSRRQLQRLDNDTERRHLSRSPLICEILAAVTTKRKEHYRSSLRSSPRSATPPLDALPLRRGTVINGPINSDRLRRRWVQTNDEALHNQRRPYEVLPEALRANGGMWNPVTNAWMFTDTGEHSNAVCELYRTTRPSAAQINTLLAMALDGTGAQAWDFDPGVTLPDFAQYSRDEASPLLSAGYTVRRLLGTHPLKILPPTSHRTFSMGSLRGRRATRSRRREPRRLIAARTHSPQRRS